MPSIWRRVFPDFPAPEILKEAACAAIRADVNQYAVTWGTPRLRRALAAKYQRFYGMDVDEAREVTITCGATEACAASLLGVINPGDEVIIFEPYYENYGPDAVLCGAKPIWIPLERDGALDFDRLTAAITPRTRAIVINTPNNPTGRVFTRAELEGLAELCEKHDLIAFTDEIYEHIFYEGEHIPLATIGDMRERTVTISGLSKTFSITGWRVGTIVAPPDLTLGDPQGARLPDRRRAAPPAGGLRDRARATQRRLLSQPRRRVPRAARHPASRTCRRGLQVRSAGRGVLHHGGFLGHQLPR